jgi:hypothetical protein
MIKSYFGPITNPVTGESKDIIVSCLSKDNVKSLLIGTGILLVGIAYMGFSCFKNGARAFEMGEYEVLNALHLFKE